MDVRYEIEVPKFIGRNVPIAEIAKAIGKDALKYALNTPYVRDYVRKLRTSSGLY